MNRPSQAVMVVGAFLIAACGPSGAETEAGRTAVTFEPVTPTFEAVPPPAEPPATAVPPPPPNATVTTEAESATSSATTDPPDGGPATGDILDHPVLDPTEPGLPLVTSRDDKLAALVLIGEVETASRSRKDDYDRALFGQAWSDDTSDPLYGHDGCDTRNNILERDLAGVSHKPGTNDCVVISGTYTSPFSGEGQSFVKEQADAHHIDHVVALSYAWQLGASDWDAETRQDFANDPLNLVVVEGSLNLSKGDSDPASWLPPYKDGRCSYSVRFAAVSVKYALPNTPANKQMMLDQCEP